MMSTDWHYRSILRDLRDYGELVETRNHLAVSRINAAPVVFVETPLVTIRRTAWQKALREMEWFLSGDAECPQELANSWWKGQLNPEGKYISGYGQQLRHFGGAYDQIECLIQGLIHHPNSRRHVITTWNPAEMSVITDANTNPATPTTCHSTISQFFVRNKQLHMTTYQRSADVLLGVPHNWIQTWALLMWLAHKSGLNVGTMRWIFGDLHLYQHESHAETADKIIYTDVFRIKNKFSLKYTPSSSEFLASDFWIDGEIPDPLVFAKPALL